MRLKNLNINISSKTLSKDDSKFLDSFTKKIEKICSVFDKITQLEGYIIEEIRKELTDLLAVRSMRDEMIEAGEKEKYIHDLFIPAVNILSDKMKTAVQYWNENEETKTNEILEFIKILKKASKTIENSNPSEKIESMNIIKDLIDEFGYFKITKSIFTDNVVEKVNVLIDLKDQIVQITSEDGEGLEKEKRHKLSIDDL